MLLALQIVHTLIALVNFAALFYMVYAHWTGKRTRLLKFCYLAIVLEAITIIPFGLSCPVSLWVKHNYPAGTPDILIPKWVSIRLIESASLHSATRTRRRAPATCQSSRIESRVPETTAREVRAVLESIRRVERR